MKKAEYRKFEIQERKRERLIYAPVFMDRVVEREVETLCQQPPGKEIIAPGMIAARPSPWSREARTCLQTGALPAESEITIPRMGVSYTQATRT